MLRLPTVLVCSADATLSKLVAWNLAIRGFPVRQDPRSPCCEAPAGSFNVDVIIADLDCSGPASWQAAARLRETFRSLPVVLLSHDRPDAERLRGLAPCRHLRKPFAINNLLTAVREVVPTRR